MQCQRNRTLLNEAEKRLLYELQVAVRGHKADVSFKVRLADVLDLKDSGISSELFSYGLRAHLDFVVIEQDTFKSLFAVEYDGVEHFTDQETIERDRKKSEICRHLNFDLLRVTKCHLEDVFMGKTQLQRLVEDWFVEHNKQPVRPRIAVLSRPGVSNRIAEPSAGPSSLRSSG